MDSTNTITISRGKGEKKEWTHDLVFPKPQSHDEYTATFADKIEGDPIATVDELAWQKLVIRVQDAARIAFTAHEAKNGPVTDAATREAWLQTYIDGFKLGQAVDRAPAAPKEIKLTASQARAQAKEHGITIKGGADGMANFQSLLASLSGAKVTITEDEPAA